ncbi:hypothetical protein [Azospirillum sp.]|uniref:hypothetical protein n=1 Tax=Azospirillum sp. TaxID=34012 RepID=UPI003D760369
MKHNALSSASTATLTAQPVITPFPRDSVIEPIAVRVPVAVQVSGLSRSGLYRGIQAGAIQIRKQGKTTLVLFDSLKAYVHGLPTTEAA